MESDDEPDPMLRLLQITFLHLFGESCQPLMIKPGSRRGRFLDLYLNIFAYVLLTAEIGTLGSIILHLMQYKRQTSALAVLAKNALVTWSAHMLTRKSSLLTWENIDMGADSKIIQLLIKPIVNGTQHQTLSDQTSVSYFCGAVLGKVFVWRHHFFIRYEIII